MDNILKGVVDYLKAQDTDKKFSVITESEFLEDLIKDNKLPFIDVVGIKEVQRTITNYSFPKVSRTEYHISLLVFQDGKVLKNILSGTNSIWKLWNYIWDKIEADLTLNGLIDNINTDLIETQLVSLTKDNSIKIGLETNLILVKDIFK